MTWLNAYAAYDDFDDACKQLAHWLEVEYMTECILSTLDYATRIEFERAALEQGRCPLLH